MDTANLFKYFPEDFGHQFLFSKELNIGHVYARLVCRFPIWHFIDSTKVLRKPSYQVVRFDRYIKWFGKYLK